MTSIRVVHRWVVMAALVACGLGAAETAQAESHALIMWIGEYADPRASLDGIDLDAKQARTIAHGMGVPSGNIVEVKNRELTLQGMSGALQALAGRISKGDNVFIYYSGHGSQVAALAGASRKCSEGLVAQDLRLYFDQTLQSDLARLADKARQVVMMNDSCFSGGASEKGLYLPKGLPPPGSPRLKALPVALKAAPASGGADPDCGMATNKGLMSKNLEVVATRGAGLLYIAAARDNEWSWATPEGSLATRAWAACLANPQADTDRSGSISGEELRRCAQDYLNDPKTNLTGKHQVITLTGKLDLPLSFVAAPDATLLDASKTLEDLRAAASLSYRVVLRPATGSIRIGQDELAFSVETDREGYLYIFYVGSDGKTVDQLFPNQVDNDNLLPRGVHRFPRDSWRLKATGPAGTDYLLAVASETPMDFRSRMNRSGLFASTPATLQGAKNLAVVATHASAGGSGRYGASTVVPVREIP